MSDDDELPRGRQKPLATVTPIRDRGLELRHTAGSLSDAQMPSVDRLAATVEQRRAEAAVERMQNEVERKGSLIHAIHLDLAITRKQAAVPLEPDDIQTSHDDLTPPVASVQFLSVGSNRDEGTRLVHPFDSTTFQALSNSEKLLALNEMESRLATVERRTPVTIVPISTQDAARQGWPAEEMARYVHDDRTIAVRNDLLEAKDERDLLLRVFQKQKEAEQHVFREQFPQQNHHSERDEKRMEMMQNALASAKREPQAAESRLEQEQREYAVQLLRAYELHKVRSG